VFSTEFSETANNCCQQLNLNPNSITQSSPWHMSWRCLSKVSNLSWESCRRGPWNGDVTGKFWRFKPLWHVKMVWKNPAASQSQTCLCHSNGIWEWPWHKKI